MLDEWKGWVICAQGYCWLAPFCRLVPPLRLRSALAMPAQVALALMGRAAGSQPVLVAVFRPGRAAGSQWDQVEVFRLDLAVDSQRDQVEVFRMDLAAAFQPGLVVGFQQVQAGGFLTDQGADAPVAPALGPMLGIGQIQIVDDASKLNPDRPAVGERRAAQVVALRVD